ncbi:MAG: flagellar protein FliT [Sulfuritalea sp.]|jgi:flagellar protein FliT|nr:flagellar protein FliT [Sulfuritalea sp.]
MGPAQVIANYELLSALTGQMREAAEQGEWDQLIGIEHQCSTLVASMKPVDAEVKLDDAALERKSQLIAKILADDAEIRNRTQIWMGQLQLTMQSNRQEQLLLHAYGV